MGLYVGQIQGKHAVVVAFDHQPVFARCHTRAQIFDDAATVGATIHQIAKMDDGRGAMAGLIGGDAVMRALEEVKVAVNVANGVAVHGAALNERPGVSHPRYHIGESQCDYPVGYFHKDERARGGVPPTLFV